MVKKYSPQRGNAIGHTNFLCSTEKQVAINAMKKTGSTFLWNVATVENIHINKGELMFHGDKGSTSDYPPIRDHTSEFIDFTYYIILLRDRLKLWFAGYSQEVDIKLQQHNIFIENGEYDRKTFKKLMYKLHNINSSDFIWTVGGHGKFWTWCKHGESTLQDTLLIPNIYYMKVENLSNPRFLEWLKEKDSGFSKININSWIELADSKIGKIKDIMREKIIKDFWIEHENDTSLINPFSFNLKNDNMRGKLLHYMFKRKWIY